MTETEKQSATLGAKGPKLETRMCHECGKYTTHNADMPNFATQPETTRSFEEQEGTREATWSCELE
jgi:hypothetical protein